MNDQVIEMRSKLSLLVFLILLAIFALIARLFIVQFINGNSITAKAYELWTRQIPIEGQRGNIYDRNGKLIVGNQLAYSIAIIPRQVEDKEETATFLSELLDISYEDAFGHVTKNVSIELVKPEGRKISPEQTAKVLQQNYKGIYLTGDTKRYYPHGDILSHTLGFVGIDNQGITGIEYMYDDYLMGNTGYSKYFTDAKGGSLGNMYGIYDAAQQGLNVYLTIDLELQLLVERVLDTVDARYRPDQSMVLVMDPKTSEILALSSRPTFSPQSYQDYDQEIYNRNLPIWMSFEPGSTFKIMTYAAGIEENVFSFDEHFFDPGYVMVDGTRIKNWKPGGHGDQTFLEVIQNSNNPGFVEIGQRLGTEKLFEYIDNFGFGQKTGVDLLGESTGIVFNKDNVGPVELATSAFGQGNSTTPIQIVNAVSAAINGGYRHTPYTLKKVEMPVTGEVVFEQEPMLQQQVISEETSEKLRYALETVVAYGTGRNAYIDGYRVGGKTGTAQKVGEDGNYIDGNYIVSFVGAAPMNDPELVVYVAIDNPKDTIQYGGVVAAPIVQEILEEALQIIEVPKQLTQLEKKYNWFDDKYMDTPELVGYKKSDIRPSVFYNIEYRGSGSTVIDQMPKVGTRMIEGGTVILYLDD